MRTILLGLAFSAGIADSAAADQILASGPAWSNTQQSVAVCYLYNAGTSAVRVTKVEITQERYGVLTNTVADNCTGMSLPPGQICRRVIEKIQPTIVHACRAQVSSAADVRGAFEYRDRTNYQTLLHVELR